MMANELVANPAVALVNASSVPGLLDKIRPQWKGKSLIDRVRRLLQADPSSACQRILNAALHDLREKIKVAGLDIAAEAASQHRLPPVNGPDDIDNYSSAKIIDLSYRMGLLSRPEWRRLSRCYEIRRDLEHEDDEYEAGVEDCVYIFSTCVEVVLSKDPIQVLRVTDVKDLVEQPESSVPDAALLEDFEHAPQARQVQIVKMLINLALDANQPDLVQQNAFTFLGYFKEKSLASTVTEIGSHLQAKIGRELDQRHARVAMQAGAFPYLRQAAKKSFFEAFLNEMKKVGHQWTNYNQHGELLRGLLEVGGLEYCPDDLKDDFLEWLIKLYIGSSGGMTSYGNIRHVYYSNTGAPIAKEIFLRNPNVFSDRFEKVIKRKSIKDRLENKHISRRFEKLLDDVAGQDEDGEI
jgi:hypothetical protein